MAEKGHVAESTVERMKKELPGIVENNPLLSDYGIAKALKICRTTFYNAIKQDPELKEIMDLVDSEREDSRAHAVEDVFIRRLIDGQAAEAGYIFYLTNKMPDKYRDRRALIGSLSVGAHASASVERNKDITDDELIRETKAIIMRDNISA